MSKQNSEDSMEENDDQSLPRKKLKVGHKEEPAVRTEAAVTATATATTTVPSSMDPALLAYLENNIVFELKALKEENYVLKNELKDNYVSKNEHTALKEEHYVLKNELKANYVSKNENTALKNQINSLDARMDHIAGAFEPATTYALFESAVYKFVGPAIPNPLEEDVAGHIKYVVSLVCRTLFVNLVSPDKKEAPFSWQKPRGEKLSIAKIGSLVSHGIAGLEAFVQSQDTQTLRSWNPEDRGKLSHNGAFLDAFFSTPPTKKQSGNQTHYSKTKKYVKRSRQQYATKSSVPEDTIYNAVSRVVDALQKKGFECKKEVKENNIEALKNMIKNGSRARNRR